VYRNAHGRLVVQYYPSFQSSAECLGTYSPWIKKDGCSLSLPLLHLLPLLTKGFYCLPTPTPSCLLCSFFLGPCSISAYSNVVPPLTSTLWCGIVQCPTQHVAIKQCGHRKPLTATNQPADCLFQFRPLCLE
jgi:hypothetical protein